MDQETQRINRLLGFREPAPRLDLSDFPRAGCSVTRRCADCGEAYVTRFPDEIRCDPCGIRLMMRAGAPLGLMWRWLFLGDSYGYRR